MIFLGNENPLVKANVFQDARGSLVALEDNDFSFDIKRVYYLYNIPTGAVRGEHGHKKLEQLIICMHGKVEVTLSDGTNVRETELSEPSEILHVLPGYWRKLKFVEPGSVVCVLASREYEPEDYIHDYEEFLNWKREQNETSGTKGSDR